MRKLSVALSLLLCAACATTPKEQNQLRFESQWVRSTLKEENYGYRHSERMAPLVNGDLVYQGNGLDGVVALTADDGRVKWRFDVRNGAESGFAQDEKHLFFGASDGNFYALNKITGKIAWSFPTRTENLGMPLLNGGIVYFLSGNNILYALDAKTGKQIWNYNRGEVSSLSIRGGAKPTAYKNILYEGFSDGYLVALNINDGSVLWERKLTNNLKFVDVDASPVVDDNSIWVSSYDGALYCLSRTDGQVQWRLDDGGAVAVTIDGDNLYYSSLNHAVYSLKKATGSVNWKFSFEEKFGIPTQVLQQKNLLVFGTSDGALMGLDKQTGKMLAQFIPGAGSNATPIADETRPDDLYLYSNQANLYKLRAQWFNPAKEMLEWKRQF